MSQKLLEQMLETLKGTDPRTGAEYAYALAVLNKRGGDTERAVRFGREAIALLNQCPTDTLADCAARNVSLGGVVIPELIHENVVRSRLQPLDL
jgi:hypothetical protein